MNPWKQFQSLIRPGSKTIVTVASVHGDGTSTVTLRSGSSLRVQGDGVAVGQKAIIQQGKIVSAAPELPAVSIEV